MRTFLDWWHSQVSVRIKHLAYLGFILLLMTVATQYQVNALSNERFDSVCANRIESRDTLRNVLLDITELFDNDSEEVQAVIDLINEDYPAIDETDCA